MQNKIAKVSDERLTEARLSAQSKVKGFEKNRDQLKHYNKDFDVMYGGGDKDYNDYDEEDEYDEDDEVDYYEEEQPASSVNKSPAVASKAPVPVVKKAEEMPALEVAAKKAPTAAPRGVWGNKNPLTKSSPATTTAATAKTKSIEQPTTKKTYAAASSKAVAFDGDDEGFSDDEDFM